MLKMINNMYSNGHLKKSHKYRWTSVLKKSNEKYLNIACIRTGWMFSKTCCINSSVTYAYSIDGKDPSSLYGLIAWFPFNG